MRYFIATLKATLYSLLLLASLLIWVMTTTSGLYVGTKLAAGILPGKLHVEQLQGRLIDTVAFKHLRYQNHQFTVELSDFQLKWQIKKLFQHEIAIDQLKATTLVININDNLAIHETTTFKFPQLPLNLSINEVAIQQVHITKAGVTHQIHQIKLQAKLTPQWWQIKTLTMHVNNLAILAKGRLQPQLPYALATTLQFKSDKKASKPIGGKLEVGGDFFLYHWQGKLTRPTHLVVNGTLKNGYEFYTSAKSTQGRIDFSYLYNALNSPKIQGQITALSFDKQTINAPVQQLKLHTYFTGESLVDLSLNGDLTARYLGNLLHVTVHYKKQRLESQVTLGSNQLQLIGTAPYQWQATATLPQLQLIHPALIGLQSSITANASLSSATNGEALIVIAPGHYQLPHDNPLSRLQFAGGKIRARLNQQHLHVHGDLAIDQHKKLILTLKLPHFQLQKGLVGNQPIQGTLRLDVNSLAFLTTLSNTISNAQGQLHAILNAKGTINKPVVEGLIQLEKARASFPKQGLELNPIDIQIKSQARQWEAQGTVVSNSKPLTLQGRGAFLPEPKGSVTVKGNAIPLINTPEYRIDISPDLTIDFTQTLLVLKGTLLIPKAQIKPQIFGNTVSLTEDAVFVGNKQPPANSLPIDTDVRIVMGDDVAIDVKGLHGFLNGEFRLRQLPQGQLNAIGELTIRDGQYNAYGQNLTIEQGQLLFAGDGVDNPGIRIRAIRQFSNANASFSGSNQLLDFNTTNLQTIDFGNQTTVGIEVTGRLKSPKVELFSVPASLSQADILSLLLLGKPANQANQAGGQLLLTAISSMNLGSGAGGLQLLNQLKKTLGLDLNLQNNTKYNQETNQTTQKKSIMVGKSLSKRLYVSYNLGLTQADSNVLTLTYLLNKFFSIQINTSVTASGIDLLYTRRKE